MWLLPYSADRPQGGRRGGWDLPAAGRPAGLAETARPAGSGGAVTPLEHLANQPDALSARAAAAKSRRHTGHVAGGLLMYMHMWRYAATAREAMWPPRTRFSMDKHSPGRAIIEVTLFVNGMKEFHS